MDVRSPLNGLATIALFALLATSLLAQDRVTATGVAPVTGGNTMGARQQALTAAFRQAVESGVGTLIQSTTVLENFQLISDKIYSKAQGYVKDYKITKEGMKGANEYEVEIDAAVSMADISTDLRAIGILQEMMGNPKVMSLVQEVSKSTGASVLIQDPSSSIAVEKKLNSFNFELVDKEQVDKIRQSEMERMGEFFMDKMFDDPEAIARIARKAQEFGAQYLLMGTALIDPGPKSGGVYQANATFKCKIVDAATAEKVALTQKSESGKGNAQNAADMYAGERAGEAAAAEILPQIIQNWSKRMNQGVKYIIKIYGITNYGTQGRKVLAAVKAISGVSSCDKRLWDAKLGRLEMDVAYKGGGGDEFIDAIFAAVEGIEGFDNFDLEEQSGNNINFKVK